MDEAQQVNTRKGAILASLNGVTGKVGSAALACAVVQYMEMLAKADPTRAQTYMDQFNATTAGLLRK
jgi:hypothetical protein